MGESFRLVSRLKTRDTYYTSSTPKYRMAMFMREGNVREIRIGTTSIVQHTH
jgi:hypothetical protein